MIADSFLMAFRIIKKKRVRSFLTSIGIIISIATIFTLVSVSLGLEKAVGEQFRLLGTDKIFVQPRGQLAGPGTGGAVELTEDDVKVIEDIVGVKDLSYWAASPVEITFRDKKRFFTAVGFPLDRGDVFLESGAYKIDEGRFLEEGDSGEVMLGHRYKYDNLFEKPLSVKDKLIINDKEFRVKIILQSIGNPGDDSLVLMSIEDLREISDVGDRVDMIIVQVENENEIKNIADRIKRALDRKRGVNDKTRDYNVLTPEELLSTFGDILGVITGFLLGVAAISLIVGGIGITNTMYTSVLERTREIGVMKAIGARNRDVMTLFLIESGLLGLAGGIIGILLGMGIGIGIEYISSTFWGISLLQVVFPWYLIVGCLAFAFGIGIVSGLVPSWKASKLNPVDALRYE